MSNDAANSMQSLFQQLQQHQLQQQQQQQQQQLEGDGGVGNLATAGVGGVGDNDGNESDALSNTGGDGQHQGGGDMNIGAFCVVIAVLCTPESSIIFVVCLALSRPRHIYYY